MSDKSPVSNLKFLEEPKKFVPTFRINHTLSSALLLLIFPGFCVRRLIGLVGPALWVLFKHRVDQVLVALVDRGEAVVVARLALLDEAAARKLRGSYIHVIGSQFVRQKPFEKNVFVLYKDRRSQN
jgi:hypothetical protein